jgi:hypothetical protein
MPGKGISQEFRNEITLGYTVKKGICFEKPTLEEERSIGIHS